MTDEANAALRSPVVSLSGPRDDDRPAFFAHHGFMAPGIRLFRVIGFPAKASWVSAAFLLPLLFLCFSLWSTASESIEFSAREREGLKYVRPVLSLLNAVQQQRRAATVGASDLAATSQQVSDSLKAVAEEERLHGAVFRTGDAFKRVTGLQSRLATAPVLSDAPSTFAAHTELVAAVLTLLSDLADGSNLTLDPDIDTFYMMDASVMRQPALAEHLAQLRGTGTAVLRSSRKLPAQHDVMTTQLAFALAEQAGLETAVKRFLNANPELSTKTDVSSAVDASKAMQDQVKLRLLGDAPNGDPDAFLAMSNQTIDLQFRASAKIRDALDEALAKRVHRLQRTLYLQMGLASLGVALGIYLLIAFYRVTQGGLKEVARHLDRLADGDLSGRPRPWGRDEAALLMTTVDRTISSLRRIVEQVRNGADEIKTASDEVAKAAMDLSERTEQTAARLHQSTTAMDQIGSTVRRSAETAHGASDIVTANAEVAEEGGRVVNEAVTTMQQIRDSSGKIAEIIGVIDSIAFQTNILALNAAVEAARAGEQGRGFAVVASEVRSLSQRTATAAREVKALITSSVEQVESGSVVVEKAGGTMMEILANADRIKGLIGEISGMAASQTDELAEVGQSIQHLDGTTQQNAALVEETAAAAATLNENARRLNSEMSFFRL